MKVFVSNLFIYTNTNFEQTFVLGNDDNSLLNLTGYSAISKIKRHSMSNTEISFSILFPDLLGGRLKLSLSPQQTGSLRPGKYYYDIVLIDQYGTKTRVVEGDVFVKNAVTR